MKQMDFAVAQRPLFSKKPTTMTAVSQNTGVVNIVTNLYPINKQTITFVFHIFMLRKL